MTVAIPPDDPSLQLHYRAFLTTTSDSAPVLRLGTLAGATCLTGSRHIGVLTFRMEARITVTPPPCRTPVSSGTSQPCPRRGTRSWCRLKMFRHVIRGSLTLVSVPDRYLFPQRSRQRLFAAWGGLKPAPESRLRRAYLHLPYSSANPTGLRS